jgi:hypothetical protein
MKKRNQMKRKVQTRRRRKRPSPPRNAEQYFSQPQRTQDLWDQVVHTVSRMRSGGISLQQASKETGISPRSVLKWGGSALRKGPNGRYAAKKTDRLLRVLRVPSPHGTKEVAVKGSRQATRLAEYWNALHHYLQTGDRSRLEAFRGESINSVDGPIPLPVDGAEINRLASAQVLSFESIYGRST